MLFSGNEEKDYGFHVRDDRTPDGKLDDRITIFVTWWRGQTKITNEAQLTRGNENLIQLSLIFDSMLFHKNISLLVADEYL